MTFYQFLESLNFQTIMYHGTGIDNLPSIFQKGLQLNSPRTTGGIKPPAIYLTPNIQLAARYSMGGLSTAPLTRTPAILEIKLFGGRRHGKMAPDPLDRVSNAWQDHYDDGGDREEMSDLEDDIKRFIDLVGKKYGFSIGWISRFADSIEDLQRFNLYGYIHSLIAQAARSSYSRIRNDISRYIARSFPPGDEYFDGKVVITNSGTLQLTPEFWQSQHQNVYSRTIPPKAIKAVWVRKSDFPNVHGEERVFGHELLPSEIVDEFESRKSKLEDVGENAKKIVKNYLQDEEDKDYYVGELEDLKDGLDDELVVLIDKIISGFDEEDFDFKSILNKLDDLGREYSSYLYDDYLPGTEVIKDKTTWVRVENVASLY